MGKQTSNMKNALLLLSIVGLALVCADLHTEDRYTEDANVMAVDDSTDEMDEYDDEMEDSRRGNNNCPAGVGFTYYEAKFNEEERLKFNAISGRAGQWRFLGQAHPATAAGAASGQANGYFRMKICNDGSFARYNIALTDYSLDPQLSSANNKPATQITYHLHSTSGTLHRLHPDRNSTTISHFAMLKGHYDSTFKCGDKSSFRDAVPNFCVPKFPRAAADDYGPSCSTDKTKCELGDISGKMGKLDVVDLTTRYYDTTLAFGLNKSPEVPSCFDPQCADLTLDGALFEGSDGYNCKEWEHNNWCHGHGSSLQWANGGITAGTACCACGGGAGGGGGLCGRDLNSPRIEEYDEWGGDSGATFSSIVINACDAEVWSAQHCESSLVGARLVQYKPWGPNIPHWRAQRVWKECPHSTLYKAQRRKGDGINTGDNGKKFKGHFEMRICNDGSSAKYSGELWDIASEQTSLKYHVHTGSFENLSETGGHYDPTYKCGSASANQNPTSNKCPDNWGSKLNPTTAYPELGFELGDLSGRNGLIFCNEYKGSSRCTVDVTDTNPPRNVDFVGNGKAGNKQSNQFASIVFHRGVDGPECAECTQAPTTAPTLTPGADPVWANPVTGQQPCDTLRRFKGTGVGLAQCKALCEAETDCDGI